MVTRLDQREKRLGQLKKSGSAVSKSIAQFLRFKPMIHMGLWSNGFGAPHHGNDAIRRKSIRLPL
jgi:hypothetical protein